MPKQLKPTNNEDGFTIVETKKKQKEKTPPTKRYVANNTNNEHAIFERNTRNSASTESSARENRHIYVPAVLSPEHSTTTTNVPPVVQLEYYDPNMPIQGNNMEISSTWTVWTHDNKNDDWSVASYDPIYKISNIGEMWRFLNVFGNLNNSDYQYFIMRNGIMPIWEDNNNRDGCICSIMLECTNRTYKHIYTDICIDAFIAFCCLVFNESFVSNNSDINGLCYSSKQRNVLIKFWIKKYKDNKNFKDKLPIKLLTYISDTIDTDCKGYSTASSLRAASNPKQTESRISVQIKPIVPVY